MSFKEDIRLWWNIMCNPAKYAGKKMGAISALKLYYEATIIPFILSLIVGIPLVAIGVNTFLMPFSHTFAFLSFSVAFIIGLILSLWVFIPIGALINAFIYHLIGKYILAAWNGGYYKTFVATLFGTFPALLLYWLLPVPFINILAIIATFIWELVVLVASIAAQQKTSRVNAFVVLLASILILLVALVLFVALLMMALIPMTTGFPYMPSYMHTV